MKLKIYLILKIILNKKNYYKKNMNGIFKQEILVVDLKIEYEKGERKRKINGYMCYSGNNYAAQTACMWREHWDNLVATLEVWFWPLNNAEYAVRTHWILFTRF